MTNWPPPRTALEIEQDRVCCNRSSADVQANIAAIRKTATVLSRMLTDIGVSVEFHKQQRAIHGCQREGNVEETVKIVIDGIPK